MVQILSSIPTLEVMLGITAADRGVPAGEHLGEHLGEHYGYIYSLCYEYLDIHDLAQRN